ncbi:xylulokinase [Actinoplanes tereljensis]|uniref:Sugar kinase n=1 Tax=Paractinoplanes tereljensis TaxID=571912 RepID=A0A919NT65_9ACTN|nr:FGGY family carbohydrate kinase [Actinoplanes tereljensis]GIF23097.1 sugar kinase [Actinoplanes tereljensis]
MSPTVLGIDLGTSSVKAVVARLDGTVVAQARADYPVSSPRLGWSETPAGDWLDAAAGAVRAAVAEAGSQPLAIGLSGQMHGVVLADENGRAIRPAMLWSDSRAIDQIQEYDRLPDPLLARLANPRSPGMAGPLLAWLAIHEAVTYRAARWALQPKDWLRAQLTGRFVTEPSDASATLLYDIAGDTWSTELLGALGLDPAKLPPILDFSAAPAGLLTVDAAARLGLRPGVPVAAGAADTAAAALGSRLTEPGTIQLTIGTGAQLVMPVAERPDPLPAHPVTHLYRSATDTGWYRMGAVLNGGLTLDWVCKTLGAGWPELYAAAAVAPQADDPYFLPHVNGERTPYLDPALRGAWTGLGPRHDRGHLLRAALEGVAFGIRDALDSLDPAGQATRLRLAGGGTTDPAWRQMLADILGRALVPVDVPAASGLGAALLGARAAGLIDHIPPRPSSAAAGHQPGPRHEQYHDRHAAFRRKVRALRDSDSTTVGGYAGSAPHGAPPALG